jgi:hypothetical protein
MTAASALLSPETHRLSPGVHVYDMATLPWLQTERGTAREKPVRRDNENGLFLGMLEFDPLSRSGVHQHRGVATSYFLSGSLTDHQTTTREGSVGINLTGATHDAVSYGGCLLVSRLDGPVVIPEGSLAIHPHADKAGVRNAAPETPPDITVELAKAHAVATRLPGVVRRPLFDYAGTGHTRRMCALQFLAGTQDHRLAHSALTDLFILAGDLRVNGQAVHGPSFVIIDGGTTVSFGSEHGCSLLAWAEGPAITDGQAELYGFN